MAKWDIDAALKSIEKGFEGKGRDKNTGQRYHIRAGKKVTHEEYMCMDPQELDEFEHRKDEKFDFTELRAEMEELNRKRDAEIDPIKRKILDLKYDLHVAESGTEFDEEDLKAIKKLQYIIAYLSKRIGHD